MNFLGWDQPLLHTLANWLLTPGHVPEAPDLSRALVVVRGSRAGRRLMELLALKCSEEGTILVPPEIVTPSSLIKRLTRGEGNEPEVASPLASALAWAEAVDGLGADHGGKLFRRPGQEGSHPGLRAHLGLGRHLHQLWSELGGAGLSFQQVRQVLAERFPHIAEFELPRWDVLEALHERAAEILKSHGLIDHTDLLIRRARRGELISGRQVILAGVAEMPQLVCEFIGRLSQVPTVLIFAPESERDGFEPLGTLLPEHWKNRNAGLTAGQIHTVERDHDQAFRAAHIVRSWHDPGIAPDQITVAVPDPQALPRLREALESEQFTARWAQGRPASDAPAFQLLRLVAEYLDHNPDEPPKFEAVAALARHSDLADVSPGDWSALDRFATAHLPERFAPEAVHEVSEGVLRIQAHLARIVDLSGSGLSATDLAEWTLEFLHRTYAGRQENANSPEGRMAVQGLKLLRDVLMDSAQGHLPWPARVRPTDFLLIILSFLGDQPVPEPSQADAIQLVGWLELVEDDAPAVVVASVVEGAVPESVSSDPFLPGSLRQALALSDNAMRLARDSYALAAIMGCRSEGRGAVALIAPRFDSAENPVRPSRLLLMGLGGEELARRVWHLSGRRPAEAQLPLRGGSGYSAVAPGDEPAIQTLRVTAFRDYLESPRKFYFRQVLGLKAEDDALLELGAAEVGTLIHQVLSAFGNNPAMREETEEKVIQDFIFAEFERIVREKFGPWAQPAVEVQVDEVRRRLTGFVQAQAALRKEGWEIRYVEGDTKLECPWEADVPPGSLRLTGKIDRIDHQPSTQTWRIIDYKTSARPKVPLFEHRRRNGEWKDLQLPLYLKLAAPYARSQWGVELTPENCALVYFQLPEDEGAAGISGAFPVDAIQEAWDKATEVVSRILRREFSDNPALNLERNEPALLALCGQVGITSPEPVVLATIPLGA